jgi:hypothetical protein
MTPRLASAWDFVLTLGAVYGDEVLPGGSGFLISFGLGITAAHIVDELFERYSQRTNKKYSHPDYPIIAGQIVEKGSFALQWSVKNLYRMPSMSETSSPIDVALIELIPFHPEEDGRFEIFRRRRPILKLAPPAVGSKVKGYGYIESEVQGPVSDKVWSHRHETADGIVQQIHSPVRDSFGMAFPCFETNAIFDPGMSGGPVVDSHGRVCGMISRGLTSDYGSTSWASTIWPAMGIQIRGSSLYELARSGVVRTEGLERVSLMKVPGTEFPDVIFDPSDT